MYVYLVLEVCTATDGMEFCNDVDGYGISKLGKEYKHIHGTPQPLLKHHMQSDHAVVL